MGDYDNFVATLQQALGQLVNMALHSTHVGVEEIRHHTGIGGENIIYWHPLLVSIVTGFPLISLKGRCIEHIHKKIIYESAKEWYWRQKIHFTSLLKLHQLEETESQICLICLISSMPHSTCSSYKMYLLHFYGLGRSEINENWKRLDMAGYH